MAGKYVALAFALLFAVQVCAANRGVTRDLLAKAESRSGCKAGANSKCESVSNAIAKGDANAIAEAIGEAGENGQASAAAEAVADAIKAGKPVDTLASALAQATPLTVEEATDAIEKTKNGDTSNLAEAIAKSTGGVAIAEVISVSQAVAKSKNAIVNAVTKAFSTVNGGGVADAEAKVSAAAIGLAYAKALAQVSINLEVQGDGIAIGNGKANANALSEATAEVVASAIAGAANDFAQKTVTLKESAFSAAVAEAAAEAFGSAELTGPGKVQVEQSTISEAVAKPYAKVMLDALVAVYEDEVDSDSYVEKIESVKDDTAKVENVGKTEVEGEGTGDSGGAGTAVALKKCSGVAKFCCDNNADQTECNCRSRAFCFTRENSAGGLTTEWKRKMRPDEICKC